MFPKTYLSIIRSGFFYPDINFKNKGEHRYGVTHRHTALYQSAIHLPTFGPTGLGLLKLQAA